MTWPVHTQNAHTQPRVRIKVRRKPGTPGGFAVVGTGLGLDARTVLCVAGLDWEQPRLAGLWWAPFPFLVIYEQFQHRVACLQSADCRVLMTLPGRMCKEAKPARARVCVGVWVGVDVGVGACVRACVRVFNPASPPRAPLLPLAPLCYMAPTRPRMVPQDAGPMIGML